MSQSWVGALGKERERIWPLCKQQGLWGTGSTRGGGVSDGDDLYVWWTGMGWLAHCLCLSNGRHPDGVNETQWASYEWVFDVRVLTELDPPRQVSVVDGVQKETGIHTVQLGQFPRLTSDQAKKVRLLFT